MTDVSVIVPVYDEVESLSDLHRQITEGCRATGRPYEILFIDDGSRDGSDRRLDELAAADERVRVVHLRRNFGKSSALAAGFEFARGSILVTLDGDLQDDPAHIPEFVRRVEAGADLVSGWKRKRRDPLGKRLSSRIFNAVVRRATGLPLHDFNCGFKAYRVECVRELSVYGGLHRFLPVLAASRGFRVEELDVNHRAREHGRTKFGAWRFAEGFLDLLTVLLVTRFRVRPLQFFGLPGGLLALTGMAILTYLTVIWFRGHSIGTRPLLTLGVLCVLTGFQFVAVGLLADLLVRTSIQSREIYSVRAVRGGTGTGETTGEPQSREAPAPSASREPPISNVEAP